MKNYYYAAGLLGGIAISSSHASSLIEEVVVTAQKREQNLQDVSISVSAFSGDQIEALGVEDALEITQYIPNVQFRDQGAIDNISIRGIGLNDIADSSEAPVGFYVDEVYKSTTGGLAAQFFDLERLEVLRGPQGTLFGRNTTGGLVHAITRKPTEEFEFEASAQAGSFDQRIIEAVVSGPLTDSIRGRLAYRMEEDDGWQKNKLPGPKNDERFGSTDVWALRGHLAIDLSEDISLLLSASHMERRDVPITFVAGDPLFDFFGFVNPLGGVNDPDAFFVDLVDQDDDTDITEFTATLNWELRDNLTLTSITSYTETIRDYVEDPAGTTSLTGFGFLFNNGIGTQRELEAEQITQEIRIAQESDLANWVAGIYYFYDDKDNGLAHTFAETTLGVDPFNIRNDYSQLTKSWAVFGQADFQLSDTVTLTTGLRYTEDEKDLDLIANFESGDPTGFFTPSPLDDFSVITTTTARQNLKTESVTWRIGLDVQVLEDTLLYGNISKGFKSGGFNSNNITILPQFATEPVDQEEVITYEAGWKSTFWDGSARFNGTVFFSDYKDLQGFQSVMPQGLNLGITRLVSLGDARIMGAELEFAVAPTDALDLLFTAGWIESELVRDDPTDLLNDEELGNTPQFTFNATGIYTFDFGDSGSVSAQLAWSWVDDVSFTPGDDIIEDPREEVELQDSYSVVDARLTWVSPDEKYSVSVFGENVGDEEYKINSFFVAGFGPGATFAKPATWGVKLSYAY